MSHYPITPRLPSRSRRTFLQAIGLGVAGLGLAACTPEDLLIQPTTRLRAPALPTLVGKKPLSFHRTQVGDWQVTVFNDGTVTFPATNFAVNAPEAEVATVMAENNLPGKFVTADIGVLLIETDAQRILIDTGVGDFAGIGDGAGKLIPTLDLLGLGRADIDAVLLSHFHVDHIAGASFADAVAFPNAQYYFPQAEWDFLQSGPTGTPLDDFINLANAKLQPVAAHDQLTFFGAEEELVPGIQAVAAFGHSPGQHGFLIAAGSDQLLYMADVANHVVLGFQQPEWLFAFDAIPEATVATRRQILGRAADEGLKVVAPHLPFPGLGYVVRSEDGFRFVPQG